MRNRVSIFLCAVLLLCVSPVEAAKNPFAPFAGSWIGVESFKNNLKVTVELLMSADGRYGERVRFNGKSSTNVGHFIVEKNTVTLMIADWRPKQQCGNGTCTPIAKPVNASYRFFFSGPNTMTLNAAGGGGAVTLRRQLR